MSGGSYDYAYSKINDLARQIEDRADPRQRSRYGSDSSEPQVYCSVQKRWLTGAEAQAIIDAAASERAWFVELLHLVSEAAHDIEWVDSGDHSPGDEVESIRAIRKFISKA
jgi:hypothetical protein